jgi:hypothetical protein
MHYIVLPFPFNNVTAWLCCQAVMGVRNAFSFQNDTAWQYYERE